MTKDKKYRLGHAEQLLIDHGIDKDKAPALLQALGYELTHRDIYSNALDDREAICKAMLDLLLLTANGGSANGNPLVDLEYIAEKEVVRPIFENGTGSNGYYDINVCGDSGTAVVTDIVEQFIRKVW